MPTRPRRMSEAAYVRAHGGVCPCCRSVAITGDSVEINGDQAFQDVSCDDCQAEWTDQYKLSGFSLAQGSQPAAEEVDDDKSEDPNG